MNQVKRLWHMIMIGLRPKTYSYEIDNDSGDKKAKGTKKV